jgi:hypothetical protein
LGLADRDYMRERRDQVREKPLFTPPETSSSAGILRMAFYWVATGYLVYRAALWWGTEPHKPPTKAASNPQPPVQQAAPDNRRSNERSNSDAGAGAASRPQRAEYPSPAETRQSASHTTVTRCIVNGQTTFTDGSCPTGSISSQLTVNGSQSMSDAVPSSREASPSPPAFTVPSAEPQQSTASLDHMMIKQQCASHESSIRRIDIEARQPLPGATQDRLAAERKWHRDQQFRLRC